MRFSEKNRNLFELEMPEKCVFVSFLFLVLVVGWMKIAAGAIVGLNIGTDISNLPLASDIVNILQVNKISNVRLFNADAHMLKALSNTNIQVIIGVTNNEVLGIGESPSAAASWINKNVAAYFPTTNITAIAVGSEVLTSIPNAAPILVPAMNNLHNALVAANLNNQIKVSSPQSMDIIPKPFPPSAANFNSSFNSTIFQLLRFLKNTNSFYMLNAYPYYGYVRGNGIFPIEYALFEPLPAVKQIVDPNTFFHYNSMFEAMVDAAYYSIADLNFSGIPIVVTESGWPSSGGSNEPDATKENAMTFNNNLFLRAQNDSGPPSHLSSRIDTYIYEMFNEDKSSGPISERNWGLFYTNGTTVYSLSLSSTPEQQTGNASLFCIASNGVDASKLQDGLNWACGQNRANCTAIQQGQPCYNPNTLKDHASFAYNDYYQKMRSVGGTCDFGGTATTTSIDPSHGSCIFTGSSNSSLSFPSSPSPISPPTGWSSRLRVPEMISLFIVVLSLPCLI